MVALLLALFVAAQSAGQAPARRNDTRTWYQAYADGKRAFDQKNWQGAVDSLEAAKRARAPKPGRKIPFYGDVYDDYLPDYYLGIAYLNLRQFTQAGCHRGRLSLELGVLAILRTDEPARAE